MIGFTAALLILGVLITRMLIRAEKRRERTAFMQRYMHAGETTSGEQQTGSLTTTRHTTAVTPDPLPENKT